MRKKPKRKPRRIYVVEREDGRIWLIHALAFGVARSAGKRVVAQGDTTAYRRVVTFEEVLR